MIIGLALDTVLAASACEGHRLTPALRSVLAAIACEGHRSTSHRDSQYDGKPNCIVKLVHA